MKMIVRYAKEEDITSIIELLKVSLGESLMPKSESFWRWKHSQNPFGVSPVLLAFEENQLVGIRAFMKWRWQLERKIFTAVRAVDTATHPAHQGKGIFKKLTLQLADRCREDGVDFIFNTPNKSSMPGYLKMGWKAAGRLKMYLQPTFNFEKKINDFDLRYRWENELSAYCNVQPEYYKFLSTQISADYLNWRYGRNPNVNYNLLLDRQSQSYLVVFRLKKHSWGTEFRICDVFINDHSKLNMVKEQVQVAIKDSGARIVTGSGHLLSELLWIPKFNLGPQITTLYLSSQRNYLSANNWQPSVGDMEVF